MKRKPIGREAVEACRAGLLKYGLDRYKEVKRATWTRDFPILKEVPLWRVAERVEDDILRQKRACPPNRGEVRGGGERGHTTAGQR